LLYNLFMKNLEATFSNRAKTKILQVLCGRQASISLRHLAELADVKLYSAQRSLRDFLKEKLIFKKPYLNCTLYSLNAQHPLIQPLRQFFNELNRKFVRERAATYHQQAKQALDFATVVSPMLTKARMNYHGRHRNSR